jgi:hypothetical protein
LNVFKLMRVVLLLSVLFVILLSTWMTEKRMSSWERPILVTIYPIVADETPATRQFVDHLDVQAFEEINRFMIEQSRPYGFTVTPAFRFQVARSSEALPPPVPDQFEPVAIGWWSLKMRWWAWMRDLDDDLVSPDIQMFVLYHSLNGNQELGISVGMRKGRYGLVKAYALNSMNAKNLIVFAHEILHVLGATDKYVLSNGEPIFPGGYADPNRRPLFPQQRAEIMGGRIPVNSFSSVMPDSLDQCKIGRQTAEEIGFFAQLNKP